ncbi:MAG: 3-oxoacyl-ACP reductase FabG [Chloroflexi bacterium]|nr:3-oxoacyl-ACP reductase FabG [Chloroflexota bacterium]
MLLSGKNAVVTGAGRNIGKAIALEFARQGANIVVNARANAQEAEEVAAEARGLGVQALAAVGDVSQREDVERVMEAARNRLGHIDILVHTIAVRPDIPFLEMSEEAWDSVMAINLKSAFYCTRAVLPGMVERRYGRIILFSGMAAFMGGAGRAHVAASKTAILGLTRGLSGEFAPYQITVNCIAPGTFQTIRPERWYPGWPGPAASWRAEDRAKNIPVGRVGRPEEVASLCAYLASEQAGFITGQSLHINGGQYVT